jgi:RNase P/RNase MRP subunit p30
MKIKIGGDSYRVKYCQMSDNNGIIDRQNKTIFINNKIKNKQEEMQTLLHEIMHAYQFHFQVNEFLKIGENDVEELDKIENIIEIVVKSIVMMIVDNKKIFKKLVKSTKG